MADFQPHPSSYRDPSGYLFYHEGILYRQVNKCFADAFDRFQNSGLSQHLVGKGLLTPFEILDQNLTGNDEWSYTLRPALIPTISYPYEWCFDMLKEAALTTLEIAVEAINFGFLLKDASAFNLQWHGGKMQFIDSLSFEPYDEQKPWTAYRQFCEHFLAPLALMHYVKMPLQSLLLSYPDGIPLTLARKLLPGKSMLNLHVYLHLHLQARLSQKKLSSANSGVHFSKAKMLQLLKSLREVIEGFGLQKPSGVWSGYYEEATQRPDYLARKKEVVGGWLKRSEINTVFDAGANEGEFSLLMANGGLQVVSADFDHFSINNLYKKAKKGGLQNILPLFLDLGNPSPSIGVNNKERSALLERINVDLVLALAIIHHLAVGRNINFEKIAELFASLGKKLIIEFVPKSDEKVSLMLQTKPDVYAWYTKDAFLTAFGKVYNIVDEKEIGSSGRTVYYMELLKGSN